MAKRKSEFTDEVGPAKALKSRKEDAVSTSKQPIRKESPARKSKEGAANGQAVTEAESKAPVTSTAREGDSETTTFQIITGSYERVLHGFTATIPQTLVTGHDDIPADDPPTINFSDTFLFNAHSSAIRCLALSPPSDESSKVILATGSTDERINLYSLSTSPSAPSKSKSNPQLPTLNGTSITENSKNKELGSLLHHSSSITALCFPTRSKLLSSAEDSTIAITRTRDWTPLSTIKAPIPKPQGRPSGDTAAPGEVPAGVNDFAVHPSMKLMVSVGKGEKCMRLWNLVIGKKAGVLNFGREILASVGEGRFGSGEGRRVVWDREGEEFAVAFERGVVIFGIDCKPKATILPTPRTKVHQMHYLPGDSRNTLLVSTEDGRIMLYDTSSITSPPDTDKADDIPSSTLVAQIGGPGAGITGRVKDFEILPLPNTESTAFIIITGSSDGTVRIWSLNAQDLKDGADSEKGTGFTAKEVGRLLGTYSTGTRITCLKSFIMTGKPEEVDEEEQQAEESEESGSEDDSESMP
ncbi:60S ribosome biogenesis protein Mak11 [Trematosphaeria pertusa]|uniref:60S ribosome biogenesis protein Mak11 n=1 Tax=Trematosphaeria pertusa TaxID=390896 RepID=A0A6A6IY60_9PLEO|nr:60S ribosome biogenesis protein Mak11 [Trematosphaeria pertusa]KAF2255248.1 60S ribosome biogenesis protein Mak11 [Trematosphaeria pertusa]